VLNLVEEPASLAFHLTDVARLEKGEEAEAGEKPDEEQAHRG